MSPKCFVVLFNVFILIALSVAKQVTPDDVSVSASVLGRLAKVEGAVKQLQDENKKLRLHNKVLTERLNKVEEVCRTRDFQFLAYRKRLKSAEIAILNLKMRDLKSRNGILQESTLHKFDDHTQNDLKDEKSIPAMIQLSKPTKKQNSIRPSEVTKGSMSKRMLLPVSTPAAATTSGYRGSRIAFSAHISKHVYNLGAAQALKFDIVNDNEGGAYDQQTGVFVCPATGTYHFEATVMSYGSERVDTTIVVSGTAKARLLSQGGSGGYGQSTNSINIRLTHGDHVWIEHDGAGSKVNGYLYSHFGGFILWAD